MAQRLPTGDEIVLQCWADAVKAARRHLGLNQVAAAQRIGISQSTLSKIESAEYRLHPAMVLRLCVGLDLDPAEAFAWPRSIVDIARMRGVGSTRSEAA